MKKPVYLTFDDYKGKVQRMEGAHWSPRTTASRWDYHFRTIELVKSLNLPDASKILEMGTMGVQCVKNSKTIDYAEHWDFPGKHPDYLHDARQIPWPIEDKEFELFIALRVFQHLAPKQEECFKEAMRISKKIVLVVSEDYQHASLSDSKGISYKEFVDFFKGVHPNIYVPRTSMGSFYYWDLEKPSLINLENIMKQQNHYTDTENINSGLFSRAIKKIKKKLG